MDMDKLIVHSTLFDFRGNRCEQKKPHPRSECGYYVCMACERPRDPWGFCTNYDCRRYRAPEVKA